MAMTEDGFRGGKEPGTAPAGGFRGPWLWVAFALALGTAQPLTGQSAASLLAEAHDRYVRGLSGIQDLTLEQEIFGMTSLTYMEKEEGPDGVPVLKPRLTRTMGMLVPVPEDEEDDGFMGNPGSFLREIGQAARLEGQGTVDGRRVHILVVDDPDVLDLDPVPSGELGGNFQATRATLHLDQQDLVILRLEVTGEVTEGGTTTPVSTRVDFTDYRSVSGYMHPHTIRVQMDTQGGALDSAEMKEAQSALAELREQMERMPPEQRAMMESMLEGQMGALEAMLGGDGNGMALEIRTVSVVANRGPPEGR